MRVFVFIQFFLLLLPSFLFAGPPFLTDDPEPVEYKHQEIYLFSTFDKAVDSQAVEAPAFEYNFGAAPDLQLHLVAPLVYFSPQEGSSHYGFGDTELGIKYRFVKEADNCPQIGFFPMVEFSTGNAKRGLGNGKAWFKLPLWLQKRWGPWTSYGGAGFALNNASGMRNHVYGGLLLQRDFGKRLTLGGEIFGQQPDATDGKGFGLLNFGGYYNFTSEFSLLFSAGHTFSGERHAIAYLGLYWTW